MLRVLIGVDDGIALAALDGHRHDFIGELTGFLRGFGFLLRAQGERVLLVTGQLPLACHVLGGVAHVIAVEGVPKAVFDHGVDQLATAHFHAVAQVHHVWGLAHTFQTTGDDDVAVTHFDGLVAECHGTQTRAAKLVDAVCGLFGWNAGAHSGLACRVLTAACC